MSLLGIHLTIMAGAGIPLPLPMSALDALASIEITQSGDAISGLQAQFKAGRGSSLIDVADYPIMKVMGLKTGARIVVTMTTGFVPQVLFDGIITQAQLNPGQGQGDGTLAVTAEDVRMKMDLTERSESYPGMTSAAIVAVVMARYAEYGLIPMIIPPMTAEVPLPLDRVVTQSGTDYDFVQQLAAQHDYVFAVSPGPAPMTVMGYFGPQPRLGLPQRALTVNMGADTNVTSINFQYDAAATHQVTGEVQDRTTNTAVPVRSVVPLRIPLASQPASMNPTLAGERILRPDGATGAAAAMAQAQAQADGSTDVLTVEGEVDGVRYGQIIRPSALIGLRGAGMAHDGFYVVKEVKHAIQKGSYKQSFKLAREGLGTTTPVVMP